ncbi:unnamed protein product [Staurois parvus]|uniref:Uncharacterized protein n=1 Tax=Staurois parvus TaxID=386267 RepID=A0ABN9CIU9_9NEOB|nr:unnamed protein product [Staurois parvus]
MIAPTCQNVSERNFQKEQQLGLTLNGLLFTLKGKLEKFHLFKSVFQSRNATYFMFHP